jgi:hypothetical protein
MTGPGEYIPDVTEGIKRVEDLPKPRIERRSRNWPARPCPRCRHRAGRYTLAEGEPTTIKVTWVYGNPEGLSSRQGTQP